MALGDKNVAIGRAEQKTRIPKSTRNLLDLKSRRRAQLRRLRTCDDSRIVINGFPRIRRRQVITTDFSSNTWRVRCPITERLFAGAESLRISGEKQNRRCPEQYSCQPPANRPHHGPV